MPVDLDDDRDSDRMLREFVAELETAATVAAMEAVLARWLDKLAVRYFAYHVIRAKGIAGDRLPHLITTYPMAWLRHYFASDYLDHDPVVGEVLRSPLSFLWADVEAPTTLSRIQRQLMDEARDAGIAHGLTVPIIGSGAEAAALNLVADEPDLAGRAALARHRHLLQLMAIHFHWRAKSRLLESKLLGASSRRRSILSAREREILEWIARGKSTWEIAHILRVSEKAVEFHVENAKRKLQVFGRTHAVAKALMLGIIEP